MSIEFVRIIEVGPRDGLQNEPFQIPTNEKVRLIDFLSEANFPNIEVTSFVSPKWVPQMADANEVLKGIRRSSKVHYSALVPNILGYKNAYSAGIDEVAIFAAASEAFSKKNINCTIDESLERFKPIISAAQDDGVPVRGYVSCVVDCPYSGNVSPEETLYVTQTLLNMGCYEVSLGDTTGRGTPQAIRKMLLKVLDISPPSKLAGHFHDTNGLALRNIEESLKLGLRSFDTSISGLGGCPFSPGAKGNVSTEAVVKLLHQLGFKTGVNLDKLIEARSFVTYIKKEYCE